MAELKENAICNKFDSAVTYPSNAGEYAVPGRDHLHGFKQNGIGGDEFTINRVVSFKCITHKNTTINPVVSAIAWQCLAQEFIRGGGRCHQRWRHMWSRGIPEYGLRCPAQESKQGVFYCVAKKKETQQSIVQECTLGASIGGGGIGGIGVTCLSGRSAQQITPNIGYW